MCARPQAPQRDAQGRLYGDPTTFPSGIAALADFVHGLGMKLGVYSSAGNLTCQVSGGWEWARGCV